MAELSRKVEGRLHHVPVTVHTIEQTPVVDEEEVTFAMFRLEGKTHHPIIVTLEVNGVQLPIELDTGAAVSVISSTT